MTIKFKYLHQFNIDAIITIVIVHYVVRRSHIGYANFNLNNLFHVQFNLFYICIITNIAFDLYSTSCRVMQN